MPYKNGNMVWNATHWTSEMENFLRKNFQSMRNKELASALGLTLSITRNKCKELSLKHVELEYWPDEAVNFLKDNYKILGDVEIVKVFETLWPKKKGWCRGMIWQKRKYMKLFRSKEEKKIIIRRNASYGGSAFTILRNSSSLNYHPSWVAQQIARKDPALQTEIINHYPELIQATTSLLKLKRAIKVNSKTNKYEEQIQ